MGDTCSQERIPLTCQRLSLMSPLNISNNQYPVANRIMDGILNDAPNPKTVWNICVSWTSISASVLSALSVVKSTEAEEGRSRSSDFLSDVVSHCLVDHNLC